MMFSATLNKILTKPPPNKGFQVCKQMKTTVKQEKALRDQLHIEIENKMKACSNVTYDCSIPRLDGYEFCIRHILQDPRAPFKQCAYVYTTNNKKCLQPAPKYDDKKAPDLTTYCFEHSRLVQLTKTHTSVGKYKQVESNETYLNDLTHHLKIDKSTSGTSKQFSDDTDEEIDVVTPNTEDPFIHVASCSSPVKHRILDYASDSSSSDDDITNDTTWKSYEWDNSDNESVDSQYEDLLKHAGIYTAEEVTMIAKQKMMRLRVLYMEQVFRMKHLLREKRRKYLHAVRKERETLCSIHDQPKDVAHERKLYEKLKALNHYHKRHGKENVLYRKLYDKRTRLTGNSAAPKTPVFLKCIFTEGGVKCGERTLPCTKYCQKHILEDKKQILFKSCGVEKSGIVCQESVLNIFRDATCVLHMKLPASKTCTQKKFESVTEEDEDKDESAKKEDIKEEKDDTNEHNYGIEEESQVIEMFPVDDDIGNNVTISDDIGRYEELQISTDERIGTTDKLSPKSDDGEVLF